MTADQALISALEQKLLATFPPLESERRGGLFLGASEGVTGRANSAVVLGAIEEPAEAVFDMACRWYAERNLDPLFRISPLMGDELRREIERAGHEPYSPTLAMHTKLDRVDDVAPSENVVVSANAPVDEGQVSERTPDQRATIGRMMRTVDGSVAWARIERCGATAALARGVCVDRWLCVQAMFVAGQHRGEGLAAQLLGAVHRWAIDEGATDAFLNVTTGNDAAQRVYARSGYKPVYEYVYQSAG